VAAEAGLSMVTPDIRSFAPGDLAGGAAELLAAHIAEIIGEHGRCRFGLAGGTTPRKVYEQLATLPVSWDDVQLFWGDDRCVPPDDPGSNYKMVHDALLSRIDIPEQNVFRMACEVSPAEAARAYADALGDAPLDILLLGMGDDGHTASLFPGLADLSTRHRVIAAKGPVAPNDRVTLTIRAINESRAVYFLISGSAKAARLAEVASEIASGKPLLPAAFVQPESGQLIWLIDTHAATQLKGSD